jgi:coenzyme F420-0:L-glutamate ligase/coenzyme F420-1:gamma-L-glutamate ligase
MRERILRSGQGGNYSVTLTAIPNFPGITAGSDIASILIETTGLAGIQIQEGDIFALAHKIISKAEGRLVNLQEVVPSERAYEMASRTEKDPRLVELILQESQEISRMRPGLIIVRHRLGFTCANAGIDRSNVPQDSENDTVILLPKDPDDSANKIHKSISNKINKSVGIIIVDSHGRPFRLGTTGTAIGLSSMPALWDRRGEADLYGYELQHTEVGTADEIAAAASLLMGQAAEGTPAVHISGLKLPPIEGRAADLIRPEEKDLYR